MTKINIKTFIKQEVNKILNESTELDAEFAKALKHRFVNSFISNKLWTIMEYTEKIPNINKNKIHSVYIKFIEEILKEINNIGK